MPRRFAPRNDRGGTSLHLLTRLCLLHVIANQCRGPRKGAPFAGRGAPRERCPALAFGRSWAWRTLGRRHGGLWGDEVRQSASPAQGVHCGNVLTNVATPPPSACHCEPVQNGNRGAPVRPGEGDAAERLRPGFSPEKPGRRMRSLYRRGVAIRNPAEKPGKLAPLRANS